MTINQNDYSLFLRLTKELDDLIAQAYKLWLLKQPKLETRSEFLRQLLKVACVKEIEKYKKENK